MAVYVLRLKSSAKADAEARPSVEVG